MRTLLRRIEHACTRRVLKREPSGFVEHASFWLLLLLVAALLLAWVPGALGAGAEGVASLAGLVLPWFLLVLAWRWVRRRLLWTVRNRLIVVCLLMGLAPVVLFGTLAAIAAYTFAGQFATDIARVSLDAQLERLHDRDTARAIAVGRGTRPQPGSAAARPERMPAMVETWVDGQRVSTDRATGPLGAAGVPAWAQQKDFDGLVVFNGKLYLCAVTSEQFAEHSVMALASIPLTREELQSLARGLGSIILYRNFTTPPPGDAQQGRVSPKSLIWVQGGDTGPPTHFFDRKVVFPAPIPIVNWQTGAQVPAMLGVVSRPSLLYTRLFSSSVQIGTLVRDGLIAITILFAVVELLALLLAVRLGRTMTRSIGDLYNATTQIDRGNLAHRVPVERPDQLGALATSFNTMAGSLAELLEQQREKERMQNELEIAQEVQNNLFPRTPVTLPGFELHGMCQPARTVSGDYYDFIVRGERVCFALGDISGKGISAALLMATLHSAVRAYHAGDHAVAVAAGEPQAGADEAMPSPGRMLALLNHHLFSSTQPEKYATLFLACYDPATRQLTYSNGGHLTPFLMCADGTVERLACGGSVVGLLDDLSYPEATVELHPGDLFIAYSDGMTEPENDYEEFGEERLLGLLRQSRQEPLTALTAHLMRVLQQWIGDKEQPDDMTLVVARQL